MLYQLSYKARLGAGRGEIDVKVAYSRTTTPPKDGIELPDCTEHVHEPHRYSEQPTSETILFRIFCS
ncbi:hypothetical protein AC249_AIPGENE27032 [Exaiptasia diaphana]|nr:hypothetical protein AC249_AIPGENE27032 [Exaiptasia diaphana]